MTASAADLLSRSRAALREGDAATARRLLGECDVQQPTGELLELRAHAAYLELDFPTAADLWERAYAAHRATGDEVGAVRMARTVAAVHLTMLGNPAVAQGWLGRARTLAAEAPGSRESGWVALNLGMFENDRTIKETWYRDALDVARAVGDRDLQFAALAYLGASMVHRDRTDEGMALLDEALAAVAGDEVDEFIVVEEIFCQLFAACEHACDVRRAGEWIRIGEAVAQRRRLPSVSAFCRTHYGGVLTTAGRWTEAEEALISAVRLWSLGRRSGLRAGALVRLAELRIQQGRLEEAEQLLEGLDPAAAADAARPRAAVHLARGETAPAADVLGRALEQLDPSSAAAAPLWALLVEVHLAADRLDEARVAAEQVARCAERSGGAHLVATAALARGRICVASGSDPCSCLREALDGFLRAEMPVGAARARLALARALRTEQPELARAEARAALDAFIRSSAARDADAAAALLRALGVRAGTPRQAAGPLTARETEVLDLIGHGLSNPEIAARLFISRKTVEHHVANVLAKLGLRNRAGAAGYVLRSRPVSE